MQMQKRRTFPGALAGAVILVVVVVVTAGLALSGRISVLTKTRETLIARSRELLASDEESSAQAVDAGAPRDGAAPPVHRQTTPLSSAQLSAPLVHAPFVSACGAPDEMKVVAEVTVKKGRAAGVTVKSYPSDPSVASCIERAIRDLQWDISPKTDHVTVTY
jgi:hypothetical protein